MEIYAVKILNIEKERLDQLCLWIDLEKKCKIEKFINQKDSVRTLIGEILIRTIIAAELKIKNKDIKFQKNEYGKPSLKEYPEFHFNISHSGDFVVCAIDDKPIGIDIEEIRHIEYEEIARNFFTLNEFEYIMKQNLNDGLSKFYEIWTLKESYIKCCGQGLSIPLKSFSFEIKHMENIKVITNHVYKGYKFKIFNMLGYKMAVCSFNKEISDNIVFIDQKHLIEDYCKITLER
ncbi:4'-phosphopantetheinyl transferase family protein [Bacillus sp. C1]